MDQIPTNVDGNETKPRRTGRRSTRQLYEDTPPITCCLAADVAVIVKFSNCVTPFIFSNIQETYKI